MSIIKDGKPFFTIYNSFTDLLLAWTKSAHCVCVCVYVHMCSQTDNMLTNQMFLQHTLVATLKSLYASIHADVFSPGSHVSLFLSLAELWSHL